MNEFARKAGFETVDYIRPEYIVRATINTALAIVRSNRVAMERSRRYRIILDTTSDGVIAVDESGAVTAINRAACDLLGCKEGDVTGNSVSEIIPKTSILNALQENRTFTDSIEKFRNKTFVWKHRPFEVAGEVAGCVSTFSEISSVMRSESKIRRTLSKGHIARYVVDDILHQSDVMKETIGDAMQCAKTDSNLLITGETGTGKEVSRSEYS